MPSIGASAVSADGRFAVLSGPLETSRLDTATLDTTWITPEKGLAPDGFPIQEKNSSGPSQSRTEEMSFSAKPMEPSLDERGGRWCNRPAATASRAGDSARPFTRWTPAAAAGIYESKPGQGNPFHPSAARTQLQMWDLASHAEIMRTDMDGVIGSLAFDEAGSRLLVTNSMSPSESDCPSNVSVCGHDEVSARI